MKNTLTNEQLIAKAKQWVKELCESGGRKWSLRVPVDLNHDPDVIFIELCNRLEEYAQQSQPSPAGAAEGASEGISKIREVMNWISQCVDEDHDLEVSEIKMIWNDLSDAISLIESTPHSSEGMAEALRLLDTASNLVGNPGTNISSSTDLACDSWQEKYKKFLASISPGVEDKGEEGKSIVSGSFSYNDMLGFANYLRNGLTNMEYCQKEHEEHLEYWCLNYR